VTVSPSPIGAERIIADSRIVVHSPTGEVVQRLRQSIEDRLFGFPRTAGRSKFSYLAPMLFDLADKPTFFQLAFAGIVAGLTTKHLAYRETGRVSMIAAGVTLPSYFCHRFSFEAKFDVLFEALIRSMLLSHVAACTTSVIATACLAISAKIRAARSAAEMARRMREFEVERQRERAERAKPRPLLPPPPPPPTFAERMEALSRKAREEYDAELRALDSLPLDEDERDILVMRAKRSLLRKLQEGK
jgi:hypothetical protein